MPYVPQHATSGMEGAGVAADVRPLALSECFMSVGDLRSHSRSGAAVVAAAGLILLAARLPVAAGTLELEGFEDDPIELCNYPDSEWVMEHLYDKSQFEDIWRSTMILFVSNCMPTAGLPLYDRFPNLTDAELLALIFNGAGTLPAVAVKATSPTTTTHPDDLPTEASLPEGSTPWIPAGWIPETETWEEDFGQPWTTVITSHPTDGSADPLGPVTPTRVVPPLPVPVPASGLMLVSGLLALLGAMSQGRRCRL
ncbi:hypothetical protein J2Z33_003330 [Rubellimicrobium aerolatum]|nr:hypothetical protein [Rubellimicrobium aerolatum]